MRARVLQATIAAVAVAVLLLGIPLAIFGARYIYGQEVQRVETRAQDLLSSAVNSFERNRSAAEAGFVDQSVLDRAVQPQGTDIVAYVTVNQPNGVQLTSGEPVAGATIERGLTSEEQPVMGVLVSVSAWPAYIKAINVVVLVVFGSVGAFAAGAVTAAWQANRLAQPFVYLAASAEQLGAGQVRPRLDLSGVEEIDLVAAELARSSDRLAARLAVERQFTSDASHQLRTPLTALTMRLEEITLTSTEPEVQEEARISLEQVERLVGVVDDLLARSRRAQGGTTESVDVAVLFLQQEEEWRESFERADRHLNVEDSGGARVLATPGALAQVLSTLLENSLKHGGGTTTLRIREGQRGAMAIEVTDEGEGVPEDMQGKIFDRGVTSGDGTGLGLALARDLVAADGGNLQLTQRTPPVFTVFLSGVPKTLDPRQVLPIGSKISTFGQKKGRGRR
ncbi:sensor histidine kinase [Promicromonospora soli]